LVLVCSLCGVSKIRKIIFLPAGVYAIIGTIGMMAILAVGFSAMTKTILALTPKTYEELSVDGKAEYA
jgi:hypothetical protein